MYRSIFRAEIGARHQGERTALTRDPQSTRNGLCPLRRTSPLRDSYARVRTGFATLYSKSFNSSDCTLLLKKPNYNGNTLNQMKDF
jgi:hypothetical protein